MAKRTLTEARTIITGASSGIGYALARQLAAKGARLVLNARRGERLNDIAQALEKDGAQVKTVAGDIVDKQIRDRLIETSETEFGGIDVLINNAGIGAMGRFDDSDPQRLRKIMEVNFFAPMELIRAAIPVMKREDDPLVVNIGSVLGHFAVPYKSEYCASKFAMRAMSESLRSELEARGVGLLLISPSTTDSEFFDKALEDTTNNDWKKFGAMSPDRVAAATISAIEKRKSEIVLSLGGKGLVWIGRLCPPLLRWIVRPRN